MFLAAIKPQVTAQLATFKQLEKEEILDPAYGSPCSVTEKPNDMFGGSGGSSCRAIVFVGGQQVGTELD